MQENLLLTIIMGISLGGLAAAYLFYRWVAAKGTGTPAMIAIGDDIREGANAFLKRQNSTILKMAMGVAAALFLGYGFARQHQVFDPVGSSGELAFWITFSFILGALCSVIAGYVGMWVSIRANVRAAAGALKGANELLQIALRGGAVSGLMVVSMSLLGVGGLFILVKAFTVVEQVKIPFLIVGYGFGASFVALFAQLGGGIYTKAADVGADLVGKVEHGIPEDDPRNPAVIADLVGDNVGDCAGRGADLFESTAAENIGAMILAGAMAASMPGADPKWVIGVLMFPLLSRALGIIASVIGVMTVKISEEEAPMNGIKRGYFVTTAIYAIALGASCKLLLDHPSAPDAWIFFFGAGLIGLLMSVAFLFITQYYTDEKYRPVMDVVDSSKTGPATNVISGLSMGMESTALSSVAISVALLAAYFLGSLSGIPHAGLFGTAVATMGMLGPAAFILALDTLGPIADNAGGIIEMSKQSSEIRERTDKLDAVGNTTKALTKGYAIGSAALAAFLLFRAYIDEVNNYGAHLVSVDMAKPAVFVSALLGAALVFIFSSLAIRAVGKVASIIIEEVRNQFREKPGILTGADAPDYGRCVDHATQGALFFMIGPGLIAVCAPIGVGIVFRQFGIGAEAMASFLMVGTISGILMATTLNNSGGAWDNAKKHIEAGALGGKGSDAHKAAVVGDTVGDPFKDTAGPSIHVLIKLLATVTLVFAPLFIS